MKMKCIGALARAINSKHELACVGFTVNVSACGSVTDRSDGKTYIFFSSGCFYIFVL
jgi:hypothetical protein